MIYVLSGSPSLYAVIAVTYPAGSTCGITTDPSGYSDVIYAKDTSGYWLFTVPYAGNWYVASYTGAISNPDKITYKVVGITTKGQSENVTLAYETYYYNKGDKCTAVTGGWTKTGSGGSLTFNTASMTLKANNFNNKTDASTANKVNLENIKTLHFSVKSATSYPTPGYPRVGVSTINNPDPNKNTNWTVYKNLSASSSFGTVSIDVSSLTGSYYIVFGGFNGDSGSATIEVQAIWGE